MQLIDEEKEIQMELLDIKGKYNKLLDKVNFDESKYMEWDADTIVDWILSLNQGYKKYEQDLRKQMRLEGVDGALLGKLERNDFHRFGVTMLQHKIAIMQEINRLTSESVEKEEDPPAAYQENISGKEGLDQTAYIWNRVFLCCLNKFCVCVYRVTACDLI